MGTWGLGESEMSWLSSQEQEPQKGFAADTYVLLNDVHFPESLGCADILRHHTDSGDKNNISNNNRDSYFVKCLL